MPKSKKQTACIEKNTESKKTQRDKMSWTKKEVLAIIKNCRKLGVSELACGELLIRFSSPPAETKPNLKVKKIPNHPSTFNPQPTDYTLEDEDRGINQELLPLEDPSTYLEKLERGDVDVVKHDGDGIRA